MRVAIVAFVPLSSCYMNDFVLQTKQGTVEIATN